MNKQSNHTQSGGIGFWGLLAVALIVLKLTKVITWSWWLVLLPLWGWIPIALVLVILIKLLLK